MTETKHKVEGCQKDTRPILAGHTFKKIDNNNNNKCSARCIRHKCAQFSDTTSYSR